MKKSILYALEAGKRLTWPPSYFKDVTCGGVICCLSSRARNRARVSGQQLLELPEAQRERRKTETQCRVLQSQSRDWGLLEGQGVTAQWLVCSLFIGKCDKMQWCPARWSAMKDLLFIMERGGRGERKKQREKEKIPCIPEMQPEAPGND